MTQRTQSIRGMNDFLPDETLIWRHVEQLLTQKAQSYGYQELRFPIVEYTQLFARSIGEVTDIVEKEMYTFEDRNGDSLTLRPEGTAGCVRAAIENGLIQNQRQQRLWYMGPLFRHERPQKGRYRQFHQFGVEAFGLKGPDIDAEQILMAGRMIRALGLSDQVKLQLNSLGSLETRQRYRQKLIDYLTPYYESLDADSQRRLDTNPMRILDSKHPDIQPLIQNAPRLLDHLDDESKRHFDQLRELLELASLDYEINPNIVRGLDYYCHTVFEWVADTLGAQGAVCAGGRYDGLVEQLGGHPTPGIGFAMGLERLVALAGETVSASNEVDAYMIIQGQAAEKEALPISEQLRDRLPHIKLVVHAGGGSYKSQFKKANKSGARWAIIMGDDELKAGKLSLKPLRTDHDQQQMTVDELVDYLS